MRARAVVLSGVILSPLLSGAAHAADIPGDARTKAVLKVSGTPKRGVFETRSDADWYRVVLQGGQDYAVSFFSDDGDQFSIRDAKGKVLARGVEPEFTDAGFEFRAPRTGTYFVEYRHVPPSDFHTYRARVAPDCRGDTRTLCRLKEGVPQQRLLAWAGDIDWFKVELSRDRTYTATGTDLAGDDSHVYTNLFDATGAFVIGLIKEYRPPRSGTYFVKIETDIDDGFQYHVALTSP